MARLGKGHGKTTTEKPSQGEADARKASKNNEKDEAILKAKEANISIEVSEMEKDITAEAEHYREMEKNITDMQNLETVEEVVRQLEKKADAAEQAVAAARDFEDKMEKGEVPEDFAEDEIVESAEGEVEDEYLEMPLPTEELKTPGPALITPTSDEEMDGSENDENVGLGVPILQTGAEQEIDESGGPAFLKWLESDQENRRIEELLCIQYISLINAR